MISETAILLKLHKERARQSRELTTPFIKGVLLGLQIAIALVHDVGLEAKNVREEYRGRLHRWSAAQFRQAIYYALQSFKNGQRTRGIRILKGAIEHEGQPKKCESSSLS